MDLVRTAVASTPQLRQLVESTDAQGRKRKRGDEHEEAAGAITGDRKKRRSIRPQKTSYHLKIPFWRVTKVWQLSVSQAHAGWNVHLRTYNLRSEDSLIFDLARAGNVQGIRELISRGEASYLDYSCHKILGLRSLLVVC